jgi:hypothetical protein
MGAYRSGRRGALVTRGGPRPNSGRPRRADPVTADEAAREIGRYLSGGVWPSRTGDVCLDLPAAVALLAKLRRRKPPATDRTEKP